MAKIPINLKTGEFKKDPTIIGIDLGTTHSLVAYVQDGNAKAVKDDFGQTTTIPSIVHIDETGQISVGDRAKEKLVLEPENTIYSVKRLMGKSYNDIKNTGQQMAYQIIDQDEEALVKIKIHDRFYSPVELSAEILKYLKNQVEKELSSEVFQAVITVPAYFNDVQRQATRDAGKLAGLDVLRIVNEPTAASLAYGMGLDSSEHKKIAVYDLGGGTFDISILEIQDGIFEVLSTHGNTSLGGDDFDQAIMNHWISKYGFASDDIYENKALLQALRLKSEEAKKALSYELKYSSKIGDRFLEIDKVTFEKLIKPIVDKTMVACQKALQDAGITIRDLDHAILVGGSTRVPNVKSSVEHFFEKTAYDDLNPDEVVALGAAIQADILAGNQKDILLLDVTPLSLGIETVGGLMDIIIPRNSKVPARAGRQYTTSVDGQKNLKVSVYQGERDLVEHNRKLGEFVLKGIPPMAAGIPKIEIQFILDADGILKVKAKELRSNTETSVDMKPSYGISEEEMAKMLLDSIKNASTDMDQKMILEAINEANNVIHSSKKFVHQNHDILTATEVKKTNELVQKLEQAVNKKDKDDINLALQALNDYTAPLAHKALDHNIQKALSGQKL